MPRGDRVMKGPPETAVSERWTRRRLTTYACDGRRAIIKRAETLKAHGAMLLKGQKGANTK